MPPVNISKISNDVKPKTPEYILYILSGCLLIGLIIIFFTNNRLRNNTNETSGRSWIQTNAIGYILSATALLGIIPCFVVLSSPKNEILKDQKSTYIVALAAAFTRYLIYPLPIIMTMLVFIFAAIQLLTFQDRLAKHHVANEYFTWINTFFFLTIVQVLILSYDVRDAISNKSSNNSSRKYIIYLLGLFNFIILGITQVILQFFSTDG